MDVFSVVFGMELLGVQVRLEIFGELIGMKIFF
jgi:hypothetical protein